MSEGTEVERVGAQRSERSEREARLRHLFRGTPEDVLSRLSQGDAIGVAAAAAKRLRARGLLLDPERVHLRAIARMAFHGADAPLDAAFDGWMMAKIDQSIDDLLAQDLRDVQAGQMPIDPESDPRCDFIARVAGMEPGLALEAAVKFNALPEAPRRVFFELIIEARSVEDCLEAGLAKDRPELRKLAWTALDVFDPDGTAQEEYRRQRGEEE